LSCYFVGRSRSRSGSVSRSHIHNSSTSPKRHKHDTLYASPLCSREMLLREELESLERIVREYDSADKSTSRHRIHSQSPTKFGTDAPHRSPSGSRELSTHYESCLYVQQSVAIGSVFAQPGHSTFAQGLQQPSSYGFSGQDSAPDVSAIGTAWHPCLQSGLMTVDHLPFTPAPPCPPASVTVHHSPWMTFPLPVSIPEQPPAQLMDQPLSEVPDSLAGHHLLLPHGSVLLPEQLVLVQPPVQEEPTPLPDIGPQPGGPGSVATPPGIAYHDPRHGVPQSLHHIPVASPLPAPWLFLRAALSQAHRFTLSPSASVSAADGVDKGPKMSKELSPRDRGKGFICPICPSDHVSRTREELRLHLTVVHHCDLVQDVLNGKDLVVPLTGDILKRKMDEYCVKLEASCWKLDISSGPNRLQRGEETAAACTSSTAVVLDVAAPTVTPSSAASKPQITSQVAGGVDKGPTMSKELSPRDRVKDFICPICPSNHVSRTREEWRIHLTVVHHCDLVQDVLNGKDLVVPLTGDILNRKLDEYCGKLEASCWKLDVSSEPNRLQRETPSSAASKPQITSQVAGGVDKGPTMSKELSPRDRGKDFICPICPSNHVSRTREEWRLHLTVVHHCDLTQDLLNGKDLIVPLTGVILNRKLDEYCGKLEASCWKLDVSSGPNRLQQENAAACTSSTAVVLDVAAPTVTPPSSAASKPQVTSQFAGAAPRLTAHAASPVNFTQQQQQQPESIASFQPRLPSQIDTRPPAFGQQDQPSPQPVFGNSHAYITKRQDAADLCKQPPPCSSTPSSEALLPNLTASASLRFPTTANVSRAAAGDSQLSVVSMLSATSLSLSTRSSHPGEIYLSSL